MSFETREEFARRVQAEEEGVGEAYDNERRSEAEFSWGRGVEPPWARFRPATEGGRYRGTTPRYPNPLGRYVYPNGLSVYPW